MIHKESAYSIRNKITILTQECYRRIHNTSEKIDSDTKCDILSEYMNDLKESGYNEHDRLQILIGGINTHSKIKEKEEKGLRHYYRSASYKAEHCEQKNKVK